MDDYQVEYERCWRHCKGGTTFLWLSVEGLDVPRSAPDFLACIQDLLDISLRHVESPHSLLQVVLCLSSAPLRRLCMIMDGHIFCKPGHWKFRGTLCLVLNLCQRGIGNRWRWLLAQENGSQKNRACEHSQRCEDNTHLN